MWLKRKRKAPANVPNLRDEYALILQDSLTDMRPLQDVAETKHASVSDDVIEMRAQWRVHQQVMTPHVTAVAPAGTGRSVPTLARFLAQRVAGGEPDCS